MELTADSVLGPPSIGSIFTKARGKLPRIEIVDRIKKKRVKITESYLARIEKGTQIPSWEVAYGICKALNLDEDQIKLVRAKITYENLKPFASPTGSTINIKVLDTIYLDPHKK